jgi:hypothetical protein
MTEAGSTSETSVNYQTTPYNNPEDSLLDIFSVWIEKLEGKRPFGRPRF